jgi:cytochrome c2
MNALMKSATASFLFLGLMAWANPGLAASESGDVLFNKACSRCHSLEAGHNGVGPSLAGIVGKRSAMAGGYAYSPVMKAANLTWNEETLMKYLSGPQALIPCHAVQIKALVQCHGIKMTFRGFRNPADSSAVVEFLKAR